MNNVLRSQFKLFARPNRLCRSAAGLLLIATISAWASGPDFQSRFYAAGLSRSYPAFSFFAVDSLGQGRLEQNPVLAGTNLLPGLELKAGLVYALQGRSLWKIKFAEHAIKLRSDYTGGDGAPPFLLAFNQRTNHATLLGLMKPDELQMRLPCVLHLPDMGTVRITGEGALGYDARRALKPPFVRITFPPATAQHRHVEYSLDVTTIYPKLPGLAGNPRYDGFRRDWLNIFQVNPRLQMLANNASSDACAFTLFEYSDLAARTPRLARGLTCNDLVRMTLDRYLGGAKGYGQVGYGSVPTTADIDGWKTPWTSLDTLPSLLIAACNYVDSAGDVRWARAHFDALCGWAHAMMAADTDGDGLIKYPATGNYGDRPQADRRPANWWDTINFGHEDAFANALAYRACREFAALAQKLERKDEARWFQAKADQLRAAYAPTFLDPATGVLAGWKSADGRLHDYWFTFVQGAAITCGLLDDQTANSVMDHLLAKMESVGFTNFALGLPGNLVPVKKGDYIYHDTPPQVHGVPRLEDGSDGFQFYENGGATACWSYFTIHALYQLGRREEARRIFYPMLEGFTRGEFQGFDASGRSRDWRDWRGGGHGYEGLLVDNYYTLLAGFDDLQPSSWMDEILFRITIHPQ